MNYSLTVKDLLKIAKHSWKSVILVALIGALVGCGMSFLRGSNSSDISQDELTNNQHAIESFDHWTESKQDALNIVSEDLISAYENLINSPLMELDANDCSYREISFALGEETPSSRTGIVESWLADKYGDLLSPTPQYLIGVCGDYGEVRVTIWDYNGINLDDVAGEVESYLIEKFKESSITVLATSNVSRKGYNPLLFEKQDALRQDIARIQSEMSNYNSAGVWNQPQAIGPATSAKKQYLKFLIAGGIMGLLIGCAFVIYRTMRRGILLSTDQIQELLELRELGVYRQNNDADAKLLSATVGVLANENDSIMVFSDANPECIAELVNDLNSVAQQEYLCGSGLREDAENAEEMLQTTAVILPLQLGKTTVSDIQKSVKWARRFKKDILGYILLDD